jgi:hypothetical protein
MEGGVHRSPIYWAPLPSGALLATAGTRSGVGKGGRKVIISKRECDAESLRLLIINSWRLTVARLSEAVSPCWHLGVIGAAWV